MKYLISICLLCTMINSFGQDKGNSRVEKPKSFFQSGYVLEYPNDGTGLQGAELQGKFIIGGSNPIVKYGPEGVYLNVGVSYFPASRFEIYQTNIGFGFYSSLFKSLPKLKLDASLANVNYYFGSIDKQNFYGKTVDVGMNLSVGYLFSKKFGVYVKYNLPAAWTMIFKDDYTSTSLLSAGIQF